MKNIIKKFSLLLAVSVLFLGSCDKEDDQMAGTSIPMLWQIK